MFGISGFELLIILIVGFILLGDRLPDAAKALGRALRTFKTAQSEMSDVINKDLFDPNAEEPFKDPLNAIDKMGDVAKRAGSSLAGDFAEVKSVAQKSKGTASQNVSPLAAETAAKVAEKIEGTAAPAAAASTSAPAEETAAPAVEESAPAVEESVSAEEKPVQKPAESYAERRARYERERAAKLAAEAEAARLAAEAAEAAARAEAAAQAAAEAQAAAAAAAAAAEATEQAEPAISTSDESGEGE